MIRVITAILLVIGIAGTCYAKQVNLNVRGNQSVSISGEQPYLYLHDAAKAALTKDANVSHMYALDTSEVTVSDGAEVAHLTLSGRSTGHFEGGTVTYLNVVENAQVYIHKLSIIGITYSPASTVHIYAADVAFSRGKLSGMREDGGRFVIELKMLASPWDPKFGRSPKYEVPQTLPQQVVVHEPVGPSFECSKAGTPLEKMICNDSALSKLDSRLSRLFKQSIAESSDKENIKSSQRAWLRDSRNKCATSNCLAVAYAARIRELERVTGNFDKSEVRGLCRQLSAPEQRSRILQNQIGIEDINNDGKPEVIKSCWGGTMNAPCSEYSSADGKELVIEQVGFEWKDYWTFGIQAFSYGGRTLFLHSRDDFLKEPAYVSYITPLNKEYVLCEFKSEVFSSLEVAQKGYEEICDAIIKKPEALNQIRLNYPSPIPQENLGRPETIVGKSGYVDIDNDGHKEHVTELLFASGGGRGCDFNYYELVTEDGIDIAKGELRSRLLKMQGVDEAGYAARSCGRIVNRMFSYKDKVYYEQNVENNELLEHTVSLLYRDDTKTVCKFARRISTSVSAVK